MKFIKTPVKGTADMLPSDERLRESVLSMIKDSYSRFGFMQIETPLMEHIENLQSDQGGENEKLIFKIMKRGASLASAIEKEQFDALSDSGLRYDLTVPLARYYANNSEKLPSPFKALQIGNVFRADNPQKGRFRQFTQCDIDTLGDDSNLAEIELIAATSDMLIKIFKDIEISGFTVHINDRRILKAACLQAGFKEEDVGSVLISLDKYDKIGAQGVKEELLKNGFSESAADAYLEIYGRPLTECREFCNAVSKEFLPEDAVDNIETIMESVRAISDEKVSIVFDPSLVRGMGYYTGTIFEISIDGYNFSIAGGGRYDDMIGKFSGGKVSACGFSIGFERIITILKDNMKEAPKIDGNNLAILVHKDVASDKKAEIFKEAKSLREEGKTVTVLPMKKNMNAQFKKLEEEGYTEFKKVYPENS